MIEVDIQRVAADGLWEYHVHFFNASPSRYADRLVLTLEGLSSPVAPGKILQGEEHTVVATSTQKLDVLSGTIRYLTCDDQTCTMVNEELQIRPTVPSRWPSWLLPTLFFSGLSLLCLLLLWKIHWIYPVLVFAIGTLAFFGFAANQDSTMRSIGSTLCISCVGLETLPEAFALEEDYAQEVCDMQPHTVEVFHTEWCKSCPAVVHFLEQLVARCPNIQLVDIDAEKDHQLAVEKGVVTGGKTVVPTVLVDNSQRIVGASGFPDRLLKALKEVEP